MDHMGAVERPTMEYSFSAADGTISSIALPTVQANFEIKPSIIQIIRSSVQFSGLCEEDPNKHLSNFLEICDTFKFNGVSDDAVRLRIFPFLLCDTAKDWLQSLPAGSITIWASLTQKFIAKYFSPAKTAKMLNDITSFVQLDRESLCMHGNISKACLENALIMNYPCGSRLERTDKRVVDVHNIDAITTLSAQMAALTHKVDNHGAIICNGAPIGPCGACGQMGHLSQDCKVGSQFFMHEDANFISHGGRSNFNPYSNTYNPGWWSHPNFHGVIINSKGQVINNHNSKPREKKSNLEDMLFNFIITANTRFQNQDASIQNLEVQVG
ncbi:UNVERIFIED_CONTAM: hypothetical protein Slati_3693900 [Sesamum latifolium]|uniref:CCHC-type domain-containing protein n=1 Tax=Sesamum latifolium TaxID=2727402 RepID=A0AAW2U2J7_9LAMI